MDTLNDVLTHSRRAAVCTLAILLAACGGGGGGAAPEPGLNAMTSVPAPAAAATQSVPGGASPVEVPSPPDMSIEPPPGTIVTALAGATVAPDPSADVGSKVGAVGTVNAAAMVGAAGGVMAPAAAVVGTQVDVELPAGAVACQPVTCPAFAVNGSVTNTQGVDNPTAAHAYMFPGTGSVAGAYPDLGNLPTMVFPPAAVSIVEAPQ